MRKPLFSRSLNHSTSTYETLQKSIAETPNSISHLHQIHAQIITNGFSSKSVLACRLITSYASLIGTKEAHQVFDFLPRRTTHTYNHMLKAFIDQNQHQLAFKLYSNLLSDNDVSLDPVTFSIVLKACLSLSLKQEGKIVHAHVLVSGSVSDLRLATDLLQFYLKCGCLGSARKLFGLTPKKDAFVWTVMIDGLLRSGDYSESLDLFRDMRELGLKASLTTWNALISGFARDGLYFDALHHIRMMQLDDVRPCNVTLCSILPLFAQNAILKPGLEAHAYAIRNGFELDLFVVSALVDMYAKCGKLALARSIFDRVEVKDVGVWNAILVGYGMHGNYQEALSLFDKMIDRGIRPTEITFTSILSACSHGGVVSEGRRIFKLMSEDYKILAHHEHYACMVDMFGRAGLLEEAYEFVRRMPIEPTKYIWGAFLSACRIHSHVKLMEIAAKHMIESNSDGKNAGYHVMMANMYAESGRWGEMAKLRSEIRDAGLKKRTGYSWIEIGDIVHTFSMADLSHPRSVEIFGLLRNLNADISSVSVS